MHWKMGGGHVFFFSPSQILRSSSMQSKQNVTFLSGIKWFLCKTSLRLQGPYVWSKMLNALVCAVQKAAAIKRQRLTEVVLCGGVYCDKLPSSFLSSRALRIGNAGRTKRERARTRHMQIACLIMCFAYGWFTLKTWRRFNSVEIWLLDMIYWGVLYLCTYIQYSPYSLLCLIRLR